MKSIEKHLEDYLNDLIFECRETKEKISGVLEVEDLLQYSFSVVFKSKLFVDNNNMLRLIETKKIKMKPSYTYYGICKDMYNNLFTTKMFPWAMIGNENQNLFIGEVHENI